MFFGCTRLHCTPDFLGVSYVLADYLDMSAAAAIRECARDQARVCRATQNPHNHQLSTDVACPAHPLSVALDAYKQHVLAVLPHTTLMGLARFFNSSTRRISNNCTTTISLDRSMTPDTVVEAVRDSNASAARFLVCAAYYLSHRVGPPGFGQPAPALLLLKK